MLKAIVFAIFSLFVSLPVFACGVPVCDVPGQVEALKQMAFDERANYLLQLDESTRESKDPAIVKNILDFSTLALPVVTELDKNSYWVIVMVSDMVNRSTLFLSTLSTTDLSHEFLFDWYKRFVTGSAPTYRFQVLSFWQTQLKNQTVSGIEDLRALLKFMNLVAEYTLTIGDEEYMFNIARSTATEAGLQMMRLRPAFEGVYSVTLTCDNEDKEVCPKVDTFSILLGDDWRGIQAAFILKDEPRPIFEFTEVSLQDENTIVSTTGPLDDPFAPAGFTIQFDVEKQSFVGVLRTPRATKDISLSGKLIISPSKWFNTESPDSFPEFEAVEGKYLGKFIINNRRTTFSRARENLDVVIKRFGKNMFKATIRDSGNRDVLYDFSAGYYIKKVGALSFYGGNDDGTFKLTLVHRLYKGKKRWVGLLHTLRTGDVKELYFDDKQEPRPTVRGLSVP